MPILSETFAPPRIKRKGFSGFSSSLLKALISFSIRRPATPGMNSAIPAVEACALWAVPKASLTYISARDANFLANISSFFSSSA